MHNDRLAADRPGRTRLDTWLWAARMYKTRALAAEAVRGGKVQVNGARAKPGRAVRIGEEIAVRRGADTLSVVVIALADRRGPYVEAAGLYRETDASQAARAAAQARRQRSAPPPRPPAAPSGRQRAALRRLRRSAR